MKIEAMGMHHSLRFSGVLLTFGLTVEMISLIWEKPLAFLLFAFIGCAFVLAGVFVYLYSLVSARG